MHSNISVHTHICAVVLNLYIYNCVCACVFTCEVKRVRDTMVKQACACHVYHLDQSYWLISGFVQAFHSDFRSAFWPLIYVHYLHNKASQIVHVKTQG